MTNCGFTVIPHTVAMWGCNRTVVRQLFDRVSRRSSVSVFEQFTGNVALHCFTAPAEKPRLSNLLLWSSRGSSCTQQVSQQQLLHLKSALYDQLNAEQMAAVQTQEDCVRVVAGPGSGKTLVLTHRIAHLIENRGVDPSQLLVSPSSLGLQRASCFCLELSPCLCACNQKLAKVRCSW